MPITAMKHTCYFVGPLVQKDTRSLDHCKFTADHLVCVWWIHLSLHAGEHLAQLVFRSENSASLWSLNAIHAMCEMEQSKVCLPAHPRSSATHHQRFSHQLAAKSVTFEPKQKFLLKHIFIQRQVLEKLFAVSDPDSLPGSVSGPVPAAREGGG